MLESFKICFDPLTLEKLLSIKDFYYQDNFGYTPLHFLCKNKSLTVDMLRLLINKDFTIKSNVGYTPLHFLCRNESITADMIKLFPKYLFNIKNAGKYTPLHYICENKSLTVEILQLIIDQDFSVINNCGKTPLYYLCEQNTSEFDESIKYIIFPFKLKIYNYEKTLNYFPKWAEFRGEQKNINDRNFKYLEESAKKSAEILLLVLIRYQIKVPKYIKWLIITFIF